jgi:hypothetical protein
MSKNAIVVLTKGYTKLSGYNNLINRNRHISVNFYQKLTNRTNYDIIIFHEGNITVPHQQYIQSQSPKIPLIFKTVEFINNNSVCNSCPPNDFSNMFTIGYKNMCFFWSIRFLKYLSEYEYVIRVDEDCRLINIDPNIIENYKSTEIHYSSPYFQGPDSPEVVVGMEDFFNNYLKDKNLTPINSNLKCPYTNFMIINIKFFYNNDLIKEVLSKIYGTNCIFSNRWGDLPIWGYILNYLVEEKHYLEDKTISYYHGSHNIQIN